MSPSRIIKIGDSIKLTLVNCMNYFGVENSLFITLTIRKTPSMRTLVQKFDAFTNFLPASTRCALTVFGIGQGNFHIHMVAFTFPPSEGSYKRGVISGKLPPHLKKFRSQLLRSKTRAGFGKVYNIAAIRNPEAAAGYLRRNYLDLDEYRNRVGLPMSGKIRCVRYYKVPEFLRIHPSLFSRHTPSSSKYRKVMTGMAVAIGTPIDDVASMEFETGMSFEELRHAAFSMCNTIPGDPQNWPSSLFLRTLTEAGSLHNQFKCNSKNE